MTVLWVKFRTQNRCIATYRLGIAALVTSWCCIMFVPIWNCNLLDYEANLLAWKEGVALQNPTVQWKVCRRCGMNKPSSDFYRNKTNGDGLYNNCKICFSHDAATRREKLPPLEERTAISKECRRCKETKPASDFYKNKHMSDGLYTHCKASLVLTHRSEPF